jgi:hypothetical protein
MYIYPCRVGGVQMTWEDGYVFRKVKRLYSTMLLLEVG